VIGIDPDTQCVGWAQVLRFGDAFRCRMVGAISIEDVGLRGERAAEAMTQALAKLRGSGDYAVVELPEQYSKGGVNANNLILLSVITGAAGACFNNVRYVKPREWKGQQKKGINQKETLRNLHMSFKDNGPAKSPEPFASANAPLPLGWDLVPEHRQKEVLDAMGLALWGLQNWTLV
jgi:hypothetical protein